MPGAGGPSLGRRIDPRGRKAPMFTYPIARAPPRRRTHQLYPLAQSPSLHAKGRRRACETSHPSRERGRIRMAFRHASPAASCNEVVGDRANMWQQRMSDMGAPGVANFDPEPSASWPLATAALGGPEAGEGCAVAGEAAIAPELPKAPSRPAGHGHAQSQGLGQKVRRGA